MPSLGLRPTWKLMNQPILKRVLGLKGKAAHMGWRCIRSQTAFAGAGLEDCKFKAILDYSEFEVSLSYKEQTIQDPEHAKPTCSHWAILPTPVFITLMNQPFSECVHYSRGRSCQSPNVSTAEHVITVLSISSPVIPFSQGPQPGTQPLPLLIPPTRHLLFTL